MVFAFLCQSVSGTPCRVLYSSIYGDDMQNALNQGTPAESLREKRKDQLMQVACRIQSEYGFRVSAKDRLPRSYTREDPSEGAYGDKGVFRLSPGDPYSTPKTVVWQVCDNCAFVLICEVDENRIQAENVLSLIIKHIIEHVIITIDQKVAEIMLKGEKVSAILHIFLPNGQILFMNHKLIRQLEKQLETVLNK